MVCTRRLRKRERCRTRCVDERMNSSTLMGRARCEPVADATRQTRPRRHDPPRDNGRCEIKPPGPMHKTTMSRVSEPSDNAARAFPDIVDQPSISPLPVVASLVELDLVQAFARFASELGDRGCAERTGEFRLFVPSGRGATRARTMRPGQVIDVLALESRAAQNARPDLRDLCRRDRRGGEE